MRDFGPSCTGHWPVHFYRKAALAVMLGAAFLPSAAAGCGQAGGRRSPAASGRHRPERSTISMPRAATRRLWLSARSGDSAPAAGQAAAQRARSTASTPTNTVPRHWKPRSPPPPRASAPTSSAPTALCPKPSSLMSATWPPTRASRSIMSTASFAPGPPSPRAVLLLAASAPSLGELSRQLRLDEPDLRRSAPGAGRAANSPMRAKRNCSSSTSSAPRSCPAARGG